MVGEEQLITIAFLGDKAHLPGIRQVADGIIATAKMQQVKPLDKWMDSNAEIAGYHAANAVYELGKLVLICVVAVLIYRSIRRSRKAKKAAQASSDLPADGQKSE